MNEDLHKFNQSPISANEGWKEMQQLLDQHMPLKDEIAERRNFASYFIAASILLVLVFTSLKINETYPKIVNSGSIYTPPGLVQMATTGFSNSTIDKEVTRFVPTNKTAWASSNTKSEGNTKAVNSGNSKTTRAEAVTERILTTNKDIIATDVAETIKEKPALQLSVDKAVNTPLESVKNKKRHVKHLWEVSAGIGLNKSLISANATGEPNALVEVKYNVNPRFYISSGIAPYSLVKNNIGGVSKSIWVNDTARNISMYKETTTFDRLHYLDIPVTAGFNVTKHISVQAGLQVSFLINKKTSKSIEPYDFSMNRVNVPTYASIMAAMPGSTAEYDVRPKNIDSRVLAGVRYNYRKFAVGLTYQQGLSPLLKNGSINNGKNKLLSLNLLIKLK